MIRPPFTCLRCGKPLFDCRCEEPRTPRYNLSELPSLSLSRTARAFVDVCDEDLREREARRVADSAGLVWC